MTMSAIYQNGTKPSRCSSASAAARSSDVGDSISMTSGSGGISPCMHAEFGDWQSFLESSSKHDCSRTTTQQDTGY